MGLLLNPSEVRNRISIINTVIDMMIKQYQGIMKTIIDFERTEELDSRAWKILKSTVLNYHRTIAYGMTSFCGDIDKRMNELGEQLSNDLLDEDELKLSISKLEREKTIIEEEINYITRSGMVNTGFRFLVQTRVAQ